MGRNTRFVQQRVNAKLMTQFDTQNILPRRLILNILQRIQGKQIIPLAMSLNRKPVSTRGRISEFGVAENDDFKLFYFVFNCG